MSGDFVGRVSSWFGRWLDRLWRRHPSCDFSMTRSQTDE